MMPDTRNLLIVYYSQSGSTDRMAEAVIRGARHPDISGVDVRVRDALEAGVDDVLWADAYLFGTPENFGYMSGALKYFFDRIYYPCLDQLGGRPYAVFVRAGNDGTGALTSISKIATGLAKFRNRC
jgi:multimeric flavodoxin WrbA